MKKALPAVVVGAWLLVLPACEPAPDNMTEQQLDTERKNSEANADAMEKKTNTPDINLDGIHSSAQKEAEDKAQIDHEKRAAKAGAGKDKSDAMD